MGAWQVEEFWHRLATVLACASIVVTAVYILRAAGASVMGPIKDKHFLDLKDATWNERLAAVMLILAILAIGMAPFWLTNMISPDTQIIMDRLANTGGI